MEVSLKRTFVKDLRKIPEKTKKKIEAFVFVEAEGAVDIESLKGLSAISGYTAYYRKRFGNYRVGFKAEGDKILFYRVLHRKDIYRYFP